jgi:hypothetical protein
VGCAACFEQFGLLASLWIGIDQYWGQPTIQY